MIGQAAAGIPTVTQIRRVGPLARRAGLRVGVQPLAVLALPLLLDSPLLQVFTLGRRVLKASEALEVLEVLLIVGIPKARGLAGVLGALRVARTAGVPGVLGALGGPGVM